MAGGVAKGLHDAQTHTDAPALPTRASSGAAIYRAEAADRGGDAAKSLDEYRFAYDKAKGELEKAPSGSPQSIEYLRRMAAAGYNLAWDEFDRNDQAAGNKILAELGVWLGGYERRPVPPALLLPVSRFLWLKYSKTDAPVAEKDFLQKRVLELTKKRDSFLWDYGALSNQYVTTLRWIGTTDQEKRVNGREACRVVAEIEHLMPDDWTSQSVRCDIERADTHQAAKQYGLALADLRVAERRLETAEARGKASKVLKLDMVEALNLEAKIGAADPALSLDPNKTEERAARLFSAALGDGKAYFADSSDEVLKLYIPIVNALARQRNPGPEDPKIVERRAKLFGDMAAAVSPTRRYYPMMVSVATVEAGAAIQASLADLDLSRPEAALPMAQEAVAALESAKIPTSLLEYDDYCERIFQAYASVVDAYVGLKNPQAAQTALQKLQDFSTGWLEKYPWDMHDRRVLVTRVENVGMLLASTGKASDARPLLEYASNWGDRTASLKLADLLETGTGGAPDLKQAAALKLLAKKQFVEEMTLPAHKGDESYTVNAEIRQYGAGPRCPAEGPLKPEEKQCVGFVGIDDYARWVKAESANYEIKPSLVEAFRSVNQAADKTDLGFPEYAFFALRRATDPDTGATKAIAAAIYAEMQRVNFHRGQKKLIDSAGVAIRGYDPVGYFKDDKPVAGRADTFALWDGAVWLFANAENRATFLRDPNHYAPQYGGYSASEVAEDTTEWPGGGEFLVIDEKLYLFSTASRRLRWKMNASYLKSLADHHWSLMDPRNPDLNTGLAEMILERGPVPNPTEDERTRGQLSLGTQRVEEAENGGDKKELVEALGNRSWILILLGRADDALKDIDRAQALDSTVPWIEANRADALLMNGRYNEALAIYKSVADKPGPNGGKRPMCFSILGDIDSLRTFKLADPALLDRMERDVPCRREQPSSKPNQPH